MRLRICVPLSLMLLAAAVTTSGFAEAVAKPASRRACSPAGAIYINQAMILTRDDRMLYACERRTGRDDWIAEGWDATPHIGAYGWTTFRARGHLVAVLGYADDSDITQTLPVYNYVRLVDVATRRTLFERGEVLTDAGLVLGPGGRADVPGLPHPGVRLALGRVPRRAGAVGLQRPGRTDPRRLAGRRLRLGSRWPHPGHLDAQRQGPQHLDPQWHREPLLSREPPAVNGVAGRLGTPTRRLWRTALLAAPASVPVVGSLKAASLMHLVRRSISCGVALGCAASVP